MMNTLNLNGYPQHSDDSPESRIGWNGTTIYVGEDVSLRHCGFGRNCRATVLKLGRPGLESLCEVQITRAAKGSAWHPGNRVEIAAGFIEGIPLGAAYCPRKRPGPPPTGLPLVKSGNVSLYEDDWQRARDLGNGNASAGIRIALSRCPPC